MEYIYIIFRGFVDPVFIVIFITAYRFLYLPD